MKYRTTAASWIATLGLAVTAQAQVTPGLNEIYISHSGNDDMEFVELTGGPGAPANDLMILVVEGDGTSAGTLDRAWNLTGLTFPVDGFLVVGDTAVANLDLDVGPSNTLENGTNTYYLVETDAAGQQQLLGLVGTNVDADADLVTDIAAMATMGTLLLHDLVAVTDGDTGDLTYDGAQVIGPDGAFLPAGIYRPGDHPNPWCTTSFLDFDDLSNTDQPRTPGAANHPFCPQVLTFAGLTHSNLDAAHLQEVGGDLVVSNIGSSGCDGVSIDLGETQFHTIQFDTMPAPVLPTGAFIDVTSTGRLGGLPDQEIWTLRVEDVGSEFGASLDTTRVGAGTLRVEARLDGQVVSSRSYTPPPPLGQVVAIFAPEGCLIDPVWPVLPETWAMIQLANPGPVTVVGQGVVIADEVVLVAADQMVDVGPLSNNSMRGANVPQWTIHTERVGMFNQGHVAQGAARLEPSGGTLTVSNIGSSGKDGVSIDVDDTDGLDVHWQPLGPPAPGSVIQVSATGSSGGLSTSFGDLFLAAVGNDVLITPDFSPVGSSTSLVEVWLDGTRVASVSGVSGTAASVFEWPTGCGKRPSWDPYPFPCFWLPLPGPIQVNVPGAGVFTGDEIRVLAEGATTTFDWLQEIVVLCSQLPSLTLTAESTVHAFAGLNHVSLDQGRVERSGDRLVISNIGSSGCDGVSIDLGEAEYHVVQFDTAPAAVVPDGASMALTPYGVVNGTPSSEVWTLRVEDQGTQFGASLDTSLVGSSSLRVEALLDGQVVSSQTYTPPPAPRQIVAVFAPEGCLVDPFWAMEPELWAMIRIASSGPVTVIGQGTVQADEVRLIASGQTRTVGTLSRLEMRGADIPSFTLVDEAIGLFGQGHHALGEARFTASGGHLTVSNIGSSGLDGVSIDLEEVGGFDVFFEVDTVGALPASAELRVSSTGAQSGGPAMPLGDLFLTSSGTDLEITADYSPVGSSTARVEVYQGGTLVFAQGGASGILARVPEWPGGCGKRPSWDPLPFPCYWLPWPSPIPITIPGGPTVTGDELRVLAEASILQFDSLASFDLRGTDLGRLEITGQSTPAGGIGTPSCFGVGCPCGNDDPGAGCANSTGSGGVLTGSGSASAAADDLVLDATSLPPFNQGLFYMGDVQVMNPFFDGFQCALGTSFRFLCCIQSSGAAGTMTLGPGIVGLAGGLIDPSETWYFHAWHRDVPGSPCGTGANLTHLLGVTFTP